MEKARLFDPWERFIVPDFPLDCLPNEIAEFVDNSAVNIGCDLSGLAMSVMTTFSAAVHHQMRLRLKRKGDPYFVSPRLWTILVGPPSSKKSPMQRAAIAPLEVADNKLRDEYEEEKKAFLAAGDLKDAPPPPPRYIVGDTTIEKLGEILARSPRGALMRRDEIAGWIGSMEKYAAGRGGAADRAFWLQAFDGGPYTVDRVSRGEFRVMNLSVSFLGGIQPDRLAELHGLQSDGLLQRFIPVMLKSATWAEDAEVGRAPFEYTKRVHACLNMQPADVELSDDAYDAMRALQRYLFDIEQTASGITQGFQTFIGKLNGLAGSIALVLHAMQNPWAAAAEQVSGEVAECTDRIIREFVLPHGLEFYRSAEATTNGDRLQRVASWILTSGKERIVPSDLTAGVSSFRGLTLTEVNERISPMVAGGWLTPEKAGAISTAWTVNPAVKAQFEEKTSEEERRKASLAELMNSPASRKPRS